MGQIWVTSDWHLNHNKEFIYKARGFETVSDMNKAIMQNHNQSVAMDDHIYVLGDCCLGQDLNNARALMCQMKGHLHIIRGNHCTDTRIEMYKGLWNVEEVVEAKYLTYKKYHFFLSHYPALCSNFDTNRPLKQRTLNLCGHLHTTDAFTDWDKYGAPIVHCEVDAWGCAPVPLDHIIELMKEKVNE